MVQPKIIPLIKVNWLENIPIVIYFVTSDVLNGKKNLNVLRTIPPDSVQVDIIDSLLNLFNWTYVSFMYEATSYGGSGFDAERNRKMWFSKSISN